MSSFSPVSNRSSRWQPRSIAGKYINPDDGATIAVTPETVDAEAQTSDHITYYRGTGAFSATLAKNNEMDASFPSGTVATVYRKATVVVGADGSVVADTPEKGEEAFGNISDPSVQQRLTSGGYLDAQALSNLLALYKSRGAIGELPFVKQSFAPTSASILNTVQQQDMQRTPSAAPRVGAVPAAPAAAVAAPAMQQAPPPPSESVPMAAAVGGQQSEGLVQTKPPMVPVPRDYQAETIYQQRQQMGVPPAGVIKGPQGSGDAQLQIVPDGKPPSGDGKDNNPVEKAAIASIGQTQNALFN